MACCSVMPKTWAVLFFGACSKFLIVFLSKVKMLSVAKCEWFAVIGVLQGIVISVKENLFLALHSCGSVSALREADGVDAGVVALKREDCCKGNGDTEHNN